MEPYENHRPKLMSIPVANFMAVVAMLGAVVACRAAFSEHETLRSERRLQQGKVLEFVQRQETLNTIANRTRYEFNQYADSIEADSDLKEAGQLSATDPARAASLTLQAQEDHAAGRTLQAYLNFFWVNLPRSLEESLQENAAYQLRGYGFDTHWVQPPKGKTAESIWKNAEGDVEKGHKKVEWLAAAVLLFVIALAFLTFAQLSLARKNWENAFLYGGVLFSLAGLAIAVWRDENAWISLLLSAIAFGLSVPLGWKISRWLHFLPTQEEEKEKKEEKKEEQKEQEEDDEPVHPSEVEPTLFPGVRVHTAPVAHRFGRFTIGMIAFTAVLSAASGFFYSRATSRSAISFSDALENQANLFKTNSSTGASFYNTIGDMSLAQEYLLHYEAARQRSDLARQNPSLLDLKTALAQLNHWNLLLNGLAQYNKGLPGRFKSEMGPEHDRNFPSRMWSQRLRISEKAFALSDASNEESLRWQEKATTYLAMLTFFAIALYLFGQGLSMGRTRDAFGLVFFSCCLVTGGVLYGVYMSWEYRSAKIHAARPECRSQQEYDGDSAEDAARHYAEGRTLFDGASGDPQELTKAAREFECAVDARPTFAMGNLYYALSTQLAGTPQLNESGFVSITSKKSIPTITDHEQQALKMIEQQGLKTPVVPQVDYGFDSLLQGLLLGDPKIVERGVRETEKAVDLDQTDLVTKFNLGLGYLAQGRKQDGSDQYEAAIKHVRNKDQIVAGAITDLDILRRYCGGANNKAADCQEINARIIPKLKSDMVAATWPPKSPTPAAAHQKITDIQLTASAAGFAWHAPKPNIDRNKDVLAVLWYAYNPEWDTWRVLPVLSGESYWHLDDQGMASDFRSLLTTQNRTCLTDGTYRAELYVNGELAANTQPITTHQGKLVPVVFPAINLAMCYPESWESWQSRDPQDSSFVKGYSGDRGTHGVFLFTYFNPRRLPDDVAEARFVDDAVSFMASHSLTPRLAPAGTLNNCAGEPARLAAFSNSSASAVARVGMEQDGLVHVVLGFDNTGNRWDCDTIMSVTNIFANNY
jgi:hypothetical protein